MTALVLDASVAVAFVSPDEKTESIGAIVDRIVKYGAFAPSLWLYETANALHFKWLRMSPGNLDASQALETLHSLPVELVEIEAGDFRKVVLPLSRRHQLTVYDASYLHLARTFVLPLATFDKKLLAAARIEQVATIDF